MHIYINNKYLIYGNYKVKCAVGKRGIATKRKEGDLITPLGVYKIKYLLYRDDRVNKFHTSFETKKITRSLGWCDDSKSKDYNKLITYPFKHRAEKLFRKDNIYDLILVLNFNMNPTYRNKGSAIFIHVAKPNFTATKGCVALKKNNLIKLIKKIKKNTKVKIF